MQTNLYNSFNYQLEVNRNRLIEDLANEYLQMIAILYGHYIQSGERRTSEFNNMTMLEVADEFKIRTLMMRGTRIRMKKDLKEEHANNERDLLERLKKSQ